MAVKEVRDLRRLDIRTLAGELEGFRAAQTMNLSPEAVGRFTFKVVLANAPLPDAFFGRAEGSGLSASHQLHMMRPDKSSRRGASTFLLTPAQR